MTWKKLKKKTRNRLELYLTLTAMKLVRRGSLDRALRAADFLGWLVCRVLRVRRNVVDSNLLRAFPEKTAAERDLIALKSYQNFARMMFEYIRFPAMTAQELSELCVFESNAVISRVLSRRKGVVVVAAHFGNWELMAAAAVSRGYPLHVLVKKQRNREVGRLIDGLRESMGVKIIYLGAAVRGAVRALRNNECVALLGDQRAGRGGITVDFFGIPSSTHQGPAVFALKTDAPMLFASAVRGEDGRHHITFTEVPDDDLQGATPENIAELTQRHTALLEAAIRQHPDHWFWMHKRWKSRPRRQLRRETTGK